MKFFISLLLISGSFASLLQVDTLVVGSFAEGCCVPPHGTNATITFDLRKSLILHADWSGQPCQNLAFNDKSIDFDYTIEDSLMNSFQYEELADKSIEELSKFTLRGDSSDPPMSMTGNLVIGKKNWLIKINTNQSAFGGNSRCFVTMVIKDVSLFGISVYKTDNKTYLQL